MLEVGKIVNTHGLRGEVKIVSWTDYPDDFERIKKVTVKQRNVDTELTVKRIKYQKNNIIVLFEEISSIEEAEKLKGCVVCCRREELGELPEGVYYIADLIGTDVVDENGEKIGKLTDVFKTGSNDVYTVSRDGKKDLLLPVIDDVVKNVDLENGVITVHIMEGLET